MKPDQTAQVVVAQDSTTGRPISVLAESFGDLTRSGTPVLLLSEAEAPSTRWPSKFVRGLVSRGHPVLRFDTRGAGRNRDALVGYTLDDLANDAVCVLDHFVVSKVIVIGRSMGGMTAQLLALDHADRVSSLVLLSTTAGPSEADGGPEQWFIDRMTERLFEAPPTRANDRVAWLVEQLSWFAGPRFPFDRAAAEEQAAEEISTSWHEASGHGHAVVEAEPRHDRVGLIQVPALVVHGTADPVYSVAHGQTLARSIPNAELALIEGLGHEFPSEFSDQLLELCAKILDSSSK